MSIGQNRDNEYLDDMLREDVRRYLARGGKIQKVEYGYSVESERWKQMTAQQRYSFGRMNGLYRC